MVEPISCIIINMQLHIRNLQVEVINFHPKFMQIHGEMKEKEQMQDSMFMTSIFTKNSKIFKDSWIWSVVVHIAKKKDQEWIRDGSIACWFKFSGERGAIFRSSMAEHDAFAQRRRSFAQRADRSVRRPSLSEAALICHARQIQRSRCFLTFI